MTLREFFGPEWDLDGDPFIRELITGDDLITDHRYNYALLGESQAEGRAIAAHIEELRLSYELETLARWWAL